MTAARLDHTFFEREVRPQLGSILLDKGFITSEQLDRALAERAERRELVGEITCPIVLNVAAASCIRAAWRRTPPV